MVSKRPNDRCINHIHIAKPVLETGICWRTLRKTYEVNLTNRTPDLLAIHFKTSPSFTICTTKFASILKSFAVLLQQAQNPLTAIRSLNRLYRLPLRLGIPLILCSEVGLFRELTSIARSRPLLLSTFHTDPGTQPLLVRRTAEISSESIG